jgi:hypothetical protein
MYLKVVTPSVRYEIAPGDVVQAGVVISNSEVGQGTLSVQPLVFRLVCRNGLIASDRALRKTHVGRALESADESVLVFKDDTLRADDTAFFLRSATWSKRPSRSDLPPIAEKMQKTIGIRLMVIP